MFEEPEAVDLLMEYSHNLIREIVLGFKILKNGSLGNGSRQVYIFIFSCSGSHILVVSDDDA